MPVSPTSSSGQQLPMTSLSHTLPAVTIAAHTNSIQRHNGTTTTKWRRLEHCLKMSDHVDCSMGRN